MDSIIDLQDPDEFRPAKRVRLDAPLHVTEDVQEEIVDDDDWDDIYGIEANGATQSNLLGVDQQGVPVSIAPAGELVEPPLGNDTSTASGVNDSTRSTTSAEQAVTVATQEATYKEEVEDGVPADAIDDGDELVAPQRPIESTDGPSQKVMDEVARVDVDPAHDEAQLEEREDGGVALAEEQSAIRTDVAAQVPDSAECAVEAEIESTAAARTNGGIASKPKPAQDPEFLAAAVQQKKDQEAEWQFDASDAESSASNSDSSSDESSEDDDSGSEGGYEMLDPETAAKILMSGDGDDDDGEKGKKAGNHQPRTANEVKETVVSKPDVVVTEDMKTTYLGTVDRTVESLALIKAATPGEYQVLEAGSVLCKEDREVIGAVAETLGRVQEPMYSVAFTNTKEIEEAGLEHGTKIYYVDSHSTFVFTQPLKNLKGTDASNIHDEEVGEDEIEFSDDEAEAEYKRLRKAAKRGGRGGLSRSTFNEERATRTFGAPGHDSGYTYVQESDAPQQQYGGGMSYDDNGDVQDEFYVPLKRPDNLSQLMAGGGPPRPPQTGHFDRGRGRGRGDRGRGRGDRGRGRGCFDQRNQRGGRGGYGQEDRGRGGFSQSNGHRGNAHSFPDRHNSGSQDGRKQNSLPPRPSPIQTSPPPQPQQQFPPYQQYQQPPVPSPSPSTYQFNGWTFQYGAAHPPGLHVPQTPLESPHGGSIPAGAFVNPAFFQAQQQAQQQWTPQPAQRPAAYGAWPQVQQNVQGQYSVAPNYGGTAEQQQAQQNNLADILRQLGGPPR